MRFATLTLAVCFTAAATALGADAPPSGATSTSTTVTLKRLLEKRELALEKTPFRGWDNGIELYVHVDGPAVAGARKYGRLKIAAAKDDAGTDLTKKAKGTPDFESEQFQEVREPQTFGFSNGDDAKKPKPTGFDVEVRLRTPPVRAAKTISVRGEMQVLVGGEKKVVRVKQLKKTFGKAIEDPALKAVGVAITVQDPSKPGVGAVFGGGDGKSVPLLLKGNLDAIAEIRFVDAKGKSLNQGTMSRSDQPADNKTVSYELSEPLDDEVVLEIEVWPGQKTLKVPFELKDVKLP